MIRNSLYFEFDGISSYDYGILNVNINSGLMEEQFMANQTIVEYKVPYNDTPYYVRTDKEPLSFSVSFYFEDNWDRNKLMKVARWLNVSYYAPLKFSDEPDRVYYAKPVNDINIIHNGLEQGYLTLTMRCDSPYVYSPELTSGIYEIPYHNSNIIEIENYGYEDVLPSIYIKKIGNGNLIIKNRNYMDISMEFTSLIDGEIVNIDCQKEIIESSMTTRYDNFNNQYIQFSYGINEIEIIGNCEIAFTYQYKYL
ncbi:phage tail family protein [Niallia alba]|uniref:distal tail protein Dit n=1 Tax=Niallia alba TaxID=2729105 RepID=UPI002E1DE7D0|nr:phage tail family protein [Niallia alba]